jgi:hypothetical protein
MVEFFSAEMELRVWKRYFFKNKKCFYSICPYFPVRFSDLEINHKIMRKSGGGGGVGGWGTDREEE